MNNIHVPQSAWLFKLVVDANFRRKSVARNLVKIVQDYCKINGYLDVHVAVSECQEDARRVFADCGLVSTHNYNSNNEIVHSFQLRLMYHKQLIATAVTLLMYHLECALEPDL